MDIQCSFLVLDFAKEIETRNCLESIQSHALFPHKVIYLDNGSQESYPINFYNEGLCDTIIINLKGTGCGNGINQLFRNCDTEYAILFQNDQELTMDLNEEHLKYFIGLCKNGYACVDLAGAQAGPNNYSERAGLINVEFYNKIPKGEIGKLGGPGPFNDKRYTESYVQEFIKLNKMSIAHINPIPVKDCGKWSIREIGDGRYKHRTDTKILFIEKIPTFKTDIYPPFDDTDWELALSGSWPSEGKVPNLWKNSVFTCWND